MDKGCVASSNVASSLVVLACEAHHFSMCVLCMSSQGLYMIIARGSKFACC